MIQMANIYEDPTWFGLLFTDGSVTVKRYFDYKDLQEADASSFVAHVTVLFDRPNRDQAMTEAVRLVKAHGPKLL